MRINVADLRIDGGTQPRLEMNWVVVTEYSDAMRDGAIFPPVTAFFDGSDYWLADGFHRRQAALKADLVEIDADVRQGTQQDAQWFSFGANTSHGLRRENKDKAAAVKAALLHPHGTTKSNAEIARHCGVDNKTVTRYRTELETALEIPKVTVRSGADGKVYETANIGKSQPEEPKEETPDLFSQPDAPAPVPEPPITPPAPPVPPLPRMRYACLVIDPPWPIEKIQRDVRPNQVDMDYRSMTLEEIRALPVGELAATDCHLYLWTTHKHLPNALHLAEHWGFRYQCLLTWVKNVGFTPFSWMYSTEHVLFCHRGKVPLFRLGQRLDFHAKVREHSRKPDEFYTLVRAVSPDPRLEMFARERRDGFDVWGNEVDRFSHKPEERHGYGMEER